MAAKKELTNEEFNNHVWSEITKLQNGIDELKKSLKPAVLAKQASLNDCNKMSQKAKTKPQIVDTQKVSSERGL